MKAKMKARSGMGISNIPRQPDKPKVKPISSTKDDPLGPNIPETAKNKKDDEKPECVNKDSPTE
jgi:hypothetical protein